jgi:hypothetical protein
MNRVAVAAVLVVLLTVQGSVAGVITGAGVSDTAENNTTATTVENSTATAESTTTITGDTATAAETIVTENHSTTEGNASLSSIAMNSESAESATAENASDEESTTDTKTAIDESTDASSGTDTTTSTSSNEASTRTDEQPTEESPTTGGSSDTGTTTEEATAADGSSDDDTATDGDSSDSTTTDETASATSTQPPQTSPEGAVPSPTPPSGGQSSAGDGAPSGENGSAPPSRAGSATPPASAASGSAPSAGASAPSAQTGGAGGAPTGTGQSASASNRTASSAGTAGGTAGAAGAAQSGARGAPSGGAPSGAASGASGAPSGAGGAPSGAAGGAGTAAGASSTSSRAGAAGGASGTSASPDAEFNVTSVSSDVPVGGTGNVSVTIENTGEDATDAVVNLQSQTGALRFGQSAETSRFVGEWEEGETRTVEVTARVTRGADTDEYPVQATVSYNDDDGNSSQSAPLTFGVTPASEQGFTLDGVDSDLAAGAEGTISGTITNEGPEQATDAVVALSPNGSRAVVPRQSQYVLGDLDEGESASFEYPVSVNSTAEPGERQVSLVVQYYDSDGNLLRSRPLNAQVDIDAESDDFEITDVDTDVEAGEQGTLSVTMNNTGGDVTDSTVNFQSLSSGILFGQAANTSRFVEDWDTGDRRTFEFDVTAADGTTAATYPMQASLSYDDADGDPGQSGPIRFGVTPDEGEDDFAVVSSASEVQVGDEGPVSVTLENRGENISEATVSLQSLTGDILFGQSANATQFVGEWPAGTQRTVTFNATASNQSETRSYPLQASVSYSDSNGDQGRSGPFTLGITPQPEQSFTLANTSSTLSVGDEGNITGTITNQGPQGARNAVVRLVSQSQNIEPQATEVAVGSLSAGGTTNFSIPVEVTDSAEPGPQQFSFVVEYDNQNGDTRRSGTLSTQVDVGPQSDAFIVERANASLDVGASGAVTLNVTNNRASTVSNVNAKAFVDTPLSISTSEAYIAELRPNETQQITFDVSSGGDASAGEYPLSVDFQYDSGGESKLSDTYEVPVELTETEDGGILSSLSVMWGLGALLVLFGIGVVWSRRR